MKQNKTILIVSLLFKTFIFYNNNNKMQYPTEDDYTADFVGTTMGSLLYKASIHIMKPEDYQPWEEEDVEELSKYDEFHARSTLRALNTQAQMYNAAMLNNNILLDDMLMAAFPIPVLKRECRPRVVYDNDLLIADAAWPSVVEPDRVAKLLKHFCFKPTTTTTSSRDLIPTKLTTSHPTEPWPSVVEPTIVSKMVDYFTMKMPMTTTQQDTPSKSTPPPADVWPEVAKLDRVDLLMSYFLNK
jgi:hypothetical protein